MDIVTFVIGTIIALIGTVYAVRSYYFSRHEVMKEPNLEMCLYSKGVHSNLIFLLPYEDGTTFLLPISIVFMNTGNKAAKNVEILLQISDELYKRRMERETSKVAKAAKSVNVVDRINDTEVDEVYYRLRTIPQSSSFQLRDFIVSRQTTEIDSEVEVKSKDGIPLRVSFRIGISFPVKIAITADNADPILKNYNFYFFALDSNKSFEENCKAATKTMRGYLEESGKQLNKIVKLCFLTFEDYKNHVLPNGKDDGCPKIREAKLDSLRISLLDLVYVKGKLINPKNFR